jgi:hypothetical protein
VLGSIGDGVAAAGLVNYSGLERTPPDLKIDAIRRLGNVRYSEQVGAALEAIAKDARRQDRERVEAIDALVQLHESHARDAASRRDIRSRVGGIELPPTASQALRDSVRRATDHLHRTRDDR